MIGSYQIIDMKHWKRAMHCQAFRNSLQPMYCVTMELDITHFLEVIKKKGYSFTFAFVYAVSFCANEIEEFRYRFLDGEVVLFDQIQTSFTYLDQETELFKVVNVPITDTMQEYVIMAADILERQTAYFTGPMGLDIFQFSSIPWVSYTHISHTSSGKKEQATPLFDWGKYFGRENRILLPFSIEVHHSFVDGVHIGRLVDRLQSYLNELTLD
ncbi:chloramphenicol acetyltransferase [Lachnospiraceae bacterium KM106-2]|nr:chloramphenicol acetyltransferase [Lachnospiraceae bacterium KM106-2]